MKTIYIHHTDEQLNDDGEYCRLMALASTSGVKYRENFAVVFPSRNRTEIRINCYNPYGFNTYGLPLSLEQAKNILKNEG